LAVAVIGVVTGGAVYGSGYTQTRELLDGEHGTAPMYTLLKGVATWLTTWSGVPAGIFAPSLAIGAGIGSDLASLTGFVERPALIALGMAGFLAAVTQAPLTSFIIVMEMVAGQSMVLSLMSCTLIASVVSRLISAPLYGALTRLQMARIPTPAEAGSPEATAATVGSAAVPGGPQSRPVDAATVAATGPAAKAAVAGSVATPGEAAAPERPADPARAEDGQPAVLPPATNPPAPTAPPGPTPIRPTPDDSAGPRPAPKPDEKKGAP